MATTSRAASRRKGRRATKTRRNLVAYGGAALVVAALAAAAILTTGSEEKTSSPGARETAAVTIEGPALPPFQETSGDPAAGAPFPAISGVDFEGTAQAISDDGRPKVVLFLAHWCPHCQAEVPVVQEWLDGGGLPDGVDLYSVATATDRAQPNYPPSEWLERERWTAPVILDDEASSAAEAAGVTSYPFFVFVNADGSVHARVAGELPVERLEEMVDGLR